MSKYKDGPRFEEWWGHVPLMVRKFGIDHLALGDSPQVIEG
jgi:hypothetical protein